MKAGLRSGVCVLLMLCAGIAWAGSTTVPVPRDTEKWWTERVAEKNEALKQGPVDLLFIGDSITQGWEAGGAEAWAKYYAHRNAVNLGFSGDRTEHVLWRLQNGAMGGLSPKAAVVMIGTNNHGANTPQEIADGVAAIVQWLRANYPEMQVLLLGIFPRDVHAGDKNRGIVTEATRLFSSLDDGKRVHFLDIGKAFLEANGDLPKDIMPDALHPTAKGYRIWAETMEPTLARLLGDAPVGYVPLYDGKSLAGWKGLVDDPIKRAAMPADELAAKQAEADQKMRDHWHVEPDGVLYFDGGGSHLCTTRWYDDFEMLVDWKIEPKGDSGIYLRGSPQVQIWDPAQWPQGSGGLYNNKKSSPDPLVKADAPIGEWNHFYVRMVGEQVTVYLNDTLVVDRQVLENYWNYGLPIFPSEQLELQAHGTKVWWKNIHVRELPRGEGWRDLFNGKDLAGWEKVGKQDTVWNVENGVLYTEGHGGAWLSTTEEFGDFELELEFKVPANGNSGVFIRAPREGNPAFAGMEVQVLDDYGDQYKTLEPWQYCGSVYKVGAPTKRVTAPAGDWQKLRIRCQGARVQVNLNGHDIVDADQDAHPDKLAEHPGLKRRAGYIGLQNHETRVDYRNIRIRPL